MTPFRFLRAGIYFLRNARECVSRGPRMKVTRLAIVPLPAAAALPEVTPELLASVRVRYSRRNEGRGKIRVLQLTNPRTSQSERTGSGGRPAPLPPMPSYRFEREDEESIAHYLESLSHAAAK